MLLTLALAGSLLDVLRLSAERNMPDQHRSGGLTSFLVCQMSAGAAEPMQNLDPARARQLMRRFQNGETLSPEDQAYLDRVRQEIRRRAAARQEAPGASNTNFVSQDPANYRHLAPLTDLTNKYQGEDGGLYGGGRNEPPVAHRAAYSKESEKIHPLDANGEPSDEGKIGLITVGFSNTSMESAAFKAGADSDPRKSARVVIVNGAIGGRSAVMWAYDGAEVLPKTEQERLSQEMDLLRMPKEDRRGSKDTWPTLAARLQEAGLTPKQVQVAWMKHVDAQPRPLGGFPAHARTFQADMADILIIAKQRFPNLRVAYFSSRTFGGWGSTNSGSPEPYAYEDAFAVRWLVQSQIKGDTSLNYDPAHGEVRAPLILWGPYLWACGDKPRPSDGFTWTQDDVRSNDHLHPSAAGCHKVTELLLGMFKTDPAARRWFIGAADQSSLDRTRAVRAGGGQNVAAGQAIGPLPNNPEVQRARQLMQKQNSGQPLTDDEKAFLKQMREKHGQGGGGGPAGVVAPPPRASTGLIPLDQMTGQDKYKGQDGGLYGGGKNQPPAAHLEAALAESKKIVPLDENGKPSPKGKIVLISLGMSNTTMEYSKFKQLADADSAKSPLLVIVDGAQGGQDAEKWNHDDANTWKVAEERLTAAGVTANQVQALWLKQARIAPSRFGEFPKHSKELQGHIIGSLQLAKKRYPNLRLVYLSSRTYAGHATTGLNPEPYSYESAFAVRDIIQQQIKGDAALNWNPAEGEVKVPLLLWGPYLWTDGVISRQSDGLVWTREDCANDGTHPSPASGREKVAKLLLGFFETDSTSRSWFVK